MKPRARPISPELSLFLPLVLILSIGQDLRRYRS
jgi:hypothetical protein